MSAICRFSEPSGMSGRALVIRASRSITSTRVRRISFNDKTVFDSTDFRNIVPRFTPDARKANQALVDRLGDIAGRKEATAAQIALAWLLSRKPWIVPIPGTTKLHRLDENIGAAAIELTTDDLREIEGALSAITVQGFPNAPKKPRENIAVFVKNSAR
jgi:hypothetical protein